jgi:hypothetical protein
MQITSQTPQPRPPRGQRGSRLSWLFFLLILARPLWGIIRSLVGPQVTNTQLALVIGGVVLAGVVVMLITRGAAAASSRDRTLPIPGQPAPSFRPPADRGTTWMPPRTRPYQSQAPRFEPIITANVVLVGIIMAVLITATLALIWITTAAPS